VLRPPAVTEIVQIDIAGSIVPQSLLTPKLGSLDVMLRIVKGVLPEFVRVMSSVAPVIEKPRPLALRLAGPAIAAVPETVSGTDKGEFSAFETIDNDALRAAIAEGVAVTWIVHVAFGASEEPQVFVCEKSAALMPTMLMPLKETAVAPFWSVTVCGADENPTAVFAKLTLDGLACNASDAPWGINATWKSAGAALS
jgi:hypothetical protein